MQQFMNLIGDCKDLVGWARGDTYRNSRGADGTLKTWGTRRTLGGEKNQEF